MQKIPLLFSIFGMTESQAVHFGLTEARRPMVGLAMFVRLLAAGEIGSLQENEAVAAMKAALVDLVALSHAERPVETSAILLAFVAHPSWEVLLKEFVAIAGEPKIAKPAFDELHRLKNVGRPPTKSVKSILDPCVELVLKTADFVHTELGCPSPFSHMCRQGEFTGSISYDGKSLKLKIQHADVWLVSIDADYGRASASTEVVECYESEVKLEHQNFKKLIVQLLGMLHSVTYRKPECLHADGSRCTGLALRQIAELVRTGKIAEIDVKHLHDRRERAFKELVALGRDNAFSRGLVELGLAQHPEYRWAGQLFLPMESFSRTDIANRICHLSEPLK